MNLFTKIFNAIMAIGIILCVASLMVFSRFNFVSPFSRQDVYLFQPMDRCDGCHLLFLEPQLKVDNPKQIIMGNDAEIVVRLDNLPNFLMDKLFPKVKEGAFIETELQTESFKVVPAHKLEIPLQVGEFEKFLITPNSVGKKKLHLRSNFKIPGIQNFSAGHFRMRTDTKTIDIEVLSPDSVYGVWWWIWKYGRYVPIFLFSSGGIYKFVDLVIKLFRHIKNKKAKKKEEKEQPRIILPDDS